MNFFAQNFWTKKDRDKHETASYSSRRDASKHLHFNHERQFEILTLGQVKWPDLMKDPGRSCCISVDA